MNSEYQKSVSEKPLAANCRSGHSGQEARPAIGALDEHFLDHTRATFTVHGMTCGGCASCAHNIERTVGKLPGIGEVYLNFAAEQAVWEMMSEFFTLFSDIEGYRAYYDGVKKLPRIIFWLSSCLLAFAGALILVQ